MRKLIFIILIFTGLLTGCASDNLNAPCPNFGAFCSKTPVNSWNTNR